MTKRKGKKRSFITTTVRVPKWQRDLQSGLKKARRTAWNLLGWVGLIILVVMIARFVTGGG